MKKYGFLIVAVACVLGLYFGWSFLKTGGAKVGKAKKEKVFDGQQYFKFTDLEDGVVAASGTFKVLESEINNTAPMKAFANKKRDILFALIYKQFVSHKKAKVKKIEYSFKKVSRSPGSILNQFGFPTNHGGEIQFSAFNPSQGLAKIDGKKITEEDIDYNNFVWASYESDIFRYKLDAIDKALKRKIINAEAKKLQLPIQKYKGEHIYKKLKQEISEQDIQAYIKKYNMDNTPKSAKSAKKRLIELRQKRAENYIVEKYIMELPVEVSLTPPAYELESKDEWTPLLGGKGGELEVTLFSDTKSPQSEKLISSLYPLFKRYKGFRLSYRPVFFSTDRMQNITSQMQFCVWLKDKSKFGEYVKSTLGNHKAKTQDHLLAVADKLGLSREELKKCLLDKSSKEIVDYHLKYANYLGIQLGPVLYVGGEVLHGNIRIEDVEDIIQRKLNIPYAGVW